MDADDDGDANPVSDSDAEREPEGIAEGDWLALPDPASEGDADAERDRVELALEEWEADGLTVGKELADFVVERDSDGVTDEGAEIDCVPEPETDVEFVVDSSAEGERVA